MPRTIAVLILSVALLGCHYDRRIEYDQAIARMKAGEFTLVVITDNMVSFQKDAWHKYQWYFSPPLAEATLHTLQITADESKTTGQECHLEDIRNKP
jgi:hypothetical protein